MALGARSPVVAMATKSLSQAQTARLVAAECYRHKFDHMALTTQCSILFHLRAAEVVHHSIFRWFEMGDLIDEIVLKRFAIERQMIDLGGEQCRALAEASLSVLGTVTIGERRCITQAVEPQDFKDGAVLIKEGEPRDALFIIVEGQVSFRPVPDEPEPEPMVKSCSLLTSQPCECTLTAVGPVKVLVLHGARQRLADYRAEEAANVLPPVVNMNTYFNFNFNAPAHLHHWHMRASDAGWSCFKPVLSANTLKVPVQDDAQTGWEQSVDPACDAPVQLRKRRPPLAPMVQ